jgi:hypothetical protein
MAHWVKRLKLCRERDIGRTKLDELIALGHVRAKKAGPARNAAVLADMDSYDAYVESLPDAPGSISPTKKQQREPAPEHP